MTINVKDFNESQSILIAHGNEQNDVSKDAKIISAKPFADYKKGAVIPQNDAYFKATVEELNQEKRPAEEAQAKIADTYNVTLTPHKELRCFCGEYDVISNGAKVGHVTTKRIQFSQGELSFAVSKVLGVQNKLPIKVQSTISPAAQKLMDKNGIKLSGNLLTKDDNTILDFSQDTYEDTNMAIYFSVPKENPKKIKITVIETDREQQTAILDPTSADISEPIKYSLMK